MGIKNCNNCDNRKVCFYTEDCRENNLKHWKPGKDCLEDLFDYVQDLEKRIEILEGKKGE